jgi:putative transposase
MDERLKFIARVLDGEKMAGLCREFGISRKTGYKIVQRYNDSGLEALTDRSRRPYRHANQLPAQIETLIVRLKQDKPTWGAPKIRERLRRLYPDVHTPAISTVHALRDRSEHDGVAASLPDTFVRHRERIEMIAGEKYAQGHRPNGIVLVLSRDLSPLPM